MNPPMPRLLIVAGSDSSGGAGLEADQKVAAVHRTYAMTATTALTAQSTEGVFDIINTPPEFVKKQIDLCIEDIGVDVLKTGMLASANTVQVVADAVSKHHISVTVIDPVMVSTSGHQLLPNDAVKVLLKSLLPLTTILTPNIPEAELILEISGSKLESKPSSVDALVAVAKKIRHLGPKNVLLKGGHLPLLSESKHKKRQEKTVFNVLVCEDNSHTVVPLQVLAYFIEDFDAKANSWRGAIACNIANGRGIESAVRQALNYVDCGIKSGYALGKGFSPINHFHSVDIKEFTPGGFIEYLIHREDVKQPWKDYTHHEFVRRLGDGTLPLSCFQKYLIQDYLFLIQFSRANALAAYKARSPEDTESCAAIVLHIYREMSLHLEYCAGFGLSKADIINHDETLACTAYTRFVLDIGQSEDWFALQIAMLPCLLGYGMIAQRLYDDEIKVGSENKYLKWIENYVAEDFQRAVQRGRGLAERHALEQSARRIEQLVQIFIRATNLERGFWDMGLEP